MNLFSNKAVIVRSDGTAHITTIMKQKSESRMIMVGHIGSALRDARLIMSREIIDLTEGDASVGHAIMSLARQSPGQFTSMGGSSSLAETSVFKAFGAGLFGIKSCLQICSEAFGSL